MDEYRSCTKLDWTNPRQGWTKIGLDENRLEENRLDQNELDEKQGTDISYFIPYRNSKFYLAIKKSCFW